MAKKILFLSIFLIFSCIVSFAQESSGDFWIGLGGDTAMYSASGLSYGGSFAIGYGAGSCIGVKAVWFFNQDGIETIELNFLLRFYFTGTNLNSGPFIQIIGGPSLYNPSGYFSIPSDAGMFSAGLCLGWRFLLFNLIYIEPFVRAGYPYLYGAGISAGVRF